jgi:hypothetical protein
MESKVKNAIVENGDKNAALEKQESCPLTLIFTLTLLVPLTLRS